DDTKIGILVPGFSVRPLRTSGLFYFCVTSANSAFAVSISSSRNGKEEVMFADSLLKSAPHPAPRGAWSKLASVLLQSLALAVALAIPLFHVDRLQLVSRSEERRVGSDWSSDVCSSDL